MINDNLEISDDNSVIKIKEMNPSDVGTYMCEISNRYFWKSRRAKVNITGVGKLQAQLFKNKLQSTRKLVLVASGPGDRGGPETFFGLHTTVHKYLSTVVPYQLIQPIVFVFFTYINYVFIYTFTPTTNIYGFFFLNISILYLAESRGPTD